MSTPRFLTAVLAALLAGGACARAADEDWPAEMAKVHARFSGEAGTVAQIGDSITITMAFFTPLRGEIRNLPADLKDAHDWLRAYVRGRCWSTWKGPEWGNNGRMTSKWGADNIDAWLKRMNPEIALILFGTNDLHAGPRPPEYGEKMRKIAQACLDNGTIPVLYTIPPTADQLNNPKRTAYVETFVASVRKLAAELNVPLIDYYQEMTTRRPNDFKALLGDNVHPSYPKQYQRDFSEESLRSSGYTLRNYLTLVKLWEVNRKVLTKVKSARTAAARSAWKGPTHQSLPAVTAGAPAAAPKLDGLLDEECWRGAQPIVFRRLDGEAKPPDHATWAKVLADRSTLYVAFHCAEDRMDALVSQRRPRDGDVWADDSVEVFLKPGPEPTGQYYQITVNADGSVYDAFARQKAWQGEITAAVAKAKDAWTVEVAIALPSMKLPADPAALAGPWRLNLTRMRPPRAGQAVEESALSPTESDSSHVPERFAYAFLEAFGGKLPGAAPPKPQATSQPAARKI